MAYRPPAELDTLTWLLTQPGCVRCGAPDAATQAVCRACSQPQTSIVRPAVRSTAVTALAGLWAVGACVATMLLLGAWLQFTGRMPLAARQSDSQILKSVARILGVAALDAPIQSPTLPAWFLPAMLMLLLVATAMAAGMLARTRWAWYAGLGLSGVPTVLGLATALRLRGMPALAPLISGILVSTVLVLAHLACRADMLGVRRRITHEAGVTSAIGLFRAGIAELKAGRTYLGARHLARALGNDPGNPQVLGALAVALEQLGLPGRAQRMRDRAGKLPL